MRIEILDLAARLEDRSVHVCLEIGRAAVGGCQVGLQPVLIELVDAMRRAWVRPIGRLHDRVYEHMRDLGPARVGGSVGERNDFVDAGDDSATAALCRFGNQLVAEWVTGIGEISVDVAGSGMKEGEVRSNSANRDDRFAG